MRPIPAPISQPLRFCAGVICFARIDGDGWFPNIASSLGLVKPLGGAPVILSDAINTQVVVSKHELCEDVALRSERLKGTNRLEFSQDVSHRVLRSHESRNDVEVNR